MTDSEFLEKFNYSGLDLDELAPIAVKIDSPLGDKAVELITVTAEFKQELAKIGYIEEY